MEMGFVTDAPEEQTFLVALSVKNEAGLIKVSELLEQQEIKFKMFYEPDYNYGYTALCTEPVDFGKYTLFDRYNLVKIGS
jgi:hypothetical protein